MTTIQNALQEKDVSKHVRHAVSFLDRFEVNPSFPIVARSGGRSVGWMINTMIINIATNLVRRGSTGVTTPGLTSLNEEMTDHQNNGGMTIDKFNEMRAREGALVDGGGGLDAEEDKAHAEMGLSVTMDPRERIALLITVRNDIAVKLMAKARRRESVLMPGTMIYEPFDTVETLAETFDAQAAKESRTLTQRQKNEMVALKRRGITEEKVQAQINRRHTANVNFMKDNKNEILGEIEKVYSVIPSTLEAEGAWDKLPALDRLRLMQLLDGAWYRESERELISSVADGRRLGATNSLLLDYERIAFRDDVVKFMKSPQVKPELDAADAISPLPVFQPLPQLDVEVHTKTA